MMQIVNTTPKVLKHQIEEAIAKAVADYRKDYPNNTGVTRKCVLNMETMVNLLLSMQGGSLKAEVRKICSVFLFFSKSTFSG